MLPINNTKTIANHHNRDTSSGDVVICRLRISSIANRAKRRSIYLSIAWLLFSSGLQFFQFNSCSEMKNMTTKNTIVRQPSKESSTSSKIESPQSDTNSTFKNQYNDNDANNEESPIPNTLIILTTERTIRHNESQPSTTTTPIPTKLNSVHVTNAPFGTPLIISDPLDPELALTILESMEPFDRQTIPTVNARFVRIELTKYVLNEWYNKNLTTQHNHNHHHHHSLHHANAANPGFVGSGLGAASLPPIAGGNENVAVFGYSDADRISDQNRHNHPMNGTIQHNANAININHHHHHQSTNSSANNNNIPFVAINDNSIYYDSNGLSHQGPMPYFGDVFHAFRQRYVPIHGVLCLVICTLGIFANVTNIIVLTRPNMISAVNTILSAMAFSDLIVNISTIPYLIHEYSDNSDAASFYSYKWSIYVLFHAHVSVTAHTISIWLTCVLATLRYFVVCRSQTSNQRNWSVGMAKRTIVGVFLFVPIFCIPNYLSFSIGTYGTTEEGISLYKVGFSKLAEETKIIKTFHFWIFSCLTKLVPCVLLTFFTTVLIKKLLSARERRLRLAAYGQQARQNSNCGPQTSQQQNNITNPNHNISNNNNNNILENRTATIRKYPIVESSLVSSNNNNNIDDNYPKLSRLPVTINNKITANINNNINPAVKLVFGHNNMKTDSVTSTNSNGSLASNYVQQATKKDNDNEGDLILMSGCGGAKREVEAEQEADRDKLQPISEPTTISNQSLELSKDSGEIGDGLAAARNQGHHISSLNRMNNSSTGNQTVGPDSGIEITTNNNNTFTHSPNQLLDAAANSSLVSLASSSFNNQQQQHKTKQLVSQIEGPTRTINSTTKVPTELAVTCPEGGLYSTSSTPSQVSMMRFLPGDTKEPTQLKQQQSNLRMRPPFSFRPPSPRSASTCGGLELYSCRTDDKSQGNLELHGQTGAVQASTSCLETNKIDIQDAAHSTMETKRSSENVTTNGPMSNQRGRSIGSSTLIPLQMVRIQATQRQLNQNETTTKLLIAVMIVFLICEFPAGILAALCAVFGQEFFDAVYEPTGILMDLFALINSSVNFILYCFMSTQFRITFYRVVLHCPAPSTVN